MLTVPANIYRLNEKRSDHGHRHPPGFRLLRLLAPERPARIMEPVCWQSKATAIRAGNLDTNTGVVGRATARRGFETRREGVAQVPRGDAVRNPSASRCQRHRRGGSLVISRAELPKNSPRRGFIRWPSSAGRPLHGLAAVGSCTLTTRMTCWPRLNMSAAIRSRPVCRVRSGRL